MKSYEVFEILLQLAVLLFSVSFHEAAHGWMAERFGDPTARVQGRITMNPVKHIDLMGSIVVPFVLYLMKVPMFGWAKPVQVNPYNLRPPRKGYIWVAAAGPLSNMILVVTSIILFKIFQLTPIIEMVPLRLLLESLIFINVLLIVLNILPIPPLDGSKILEGNLRGDALRTFEKFKPYGFIIFILVIYTGIFGRIAWPILRAVHSILY